MVLEQMAVGQNLWYHFGAGAALILVYLRADWDVHSGYGIYTTNCLNKDLHTLRLQLDVLFHFSKSLVMYEFTLGCCLAGEKKLIPGPPPTNRYEMVSQLGAT